MEQNNKKTLSKSFFFFLVIISDPCSTKEKTRMASFEKGRARKNARRNACVVSTRLLTKKNNFDSKNDHCVVCYSNAAKDCAVYAFLSAFIPASQLERKLFGWFSVENGDDHHDNKKKRFEKAREEKVFERSRFFHSHHHKKV